MLDNQLLSAIGQLMEQQLEPINIGMKGLRNDICELTRRVHKVEDRMDKLENCSLSTRLTLENDIGRNIHLLAEGHSENISQIKRINKDIEHIKEKIDVLYLISENNVREITSLKKAE